MDLITTDVSDERPDIPAWLKNHELLEGQRWSTVGELGDTLPLVKGGERSFSFRRNTLGTAIERARQTPDETRPYPYLRLAYQIAASLESLRGRPVKGLGEAALALRSLPLYSVFHIIYRMALHIGSGTLTTSVDCPVEGCGHHQDVRVDVRDIPVRVWDECERLPSLEFDLQDSAIEFPPGRLAETVTIQPAPFDALCGLGAGASNTVSELTLATLVRAIVGLDTVDGVCAVQSSHVLGLSQADYVGLDADHDLLSGGPIMGGPAKCERCGGDMLVPIPWRELGFFTASSREDRQRRRRLRR